MFCGVKVLFLYFFNLLERKKHSISMFIDHVSYSNCFDILPYLVYFSLLYINSSLARASSFLSLFPSLWLSPFFSSVTLCSSHSNLNSHHNRFNTPHRDDFIEFLSPSQPWAFWNIDTRMVSCVVSASISVSASTSCTLFHPLLPNSPYHIILQPYNRPGEIPTLVFPISPSSPLPNLKLVQTLPS
jgi:hypothetical protein